MKSSSSTAPALTPSFPEEKCHKRFHKFQKDLAVSANTGETVQFSIIIINHLFLTNLLKNLTDHLI